ncbi:3'(2'),5'-bisphosphate nucleotidase CysQ [Jannaschia sp. W003]|uniref:inositol monophosphatase family protein n=1 Tax=Jannaschia sp. W003 TaxID=2867012 RepID=UPI0021A27E9E|nr:3'(2'),5'-bisphosphate nucleotidase CysQ [Jannaschia sp. W003]UWQ21714.1 3'(2'),5'-bisphosphate nucleotidase CysQ [Jannaschia sp. W003]
MRAADGDRALLERAAREAGRIAMGFWRRSPEVWQKGDQGPVTEADLAVDAMLREMLLEARPGYGWISEESRAVDRGAERVFVVDPIDGTRAFVEGGPDFTHALAVVERGAPVAAAVFQPAKGRLWSAASGAGATLNGDALAPSGRTALEGAAVLAAKVAERPEHWRAAPGFRRSFRSSLALRMALVAEGRVDGMMTLRPCWEWDIAAGALLCLEAGASATDRHGDALRFANPHPQVAGVLAGTPGVHAALLDRLAPAR